VRPIVLREAPVTQQQTAGFGEEDLDEYQEESPDLELAPEPRPKTRPKAAQTAKMAPAEEGLMSIEEAVRRIPVTLQTEMQEQLRADFREVVHWTPPKRA
jgi:hypothetical protein